MTLWPVKYVLVATLYQHDSYVNSRAIAEYPTKVDAEKYSIVAAVMMNEGLSDDLEVSISIQEKWEDWLEEPEHVHYLDDTQSYP